MDLNTMINNYLNYSKIYQSNGTYRFYKSHLEYLNNYFNNINITTSENITNDIITNYIFYEKNKNVSHATINKRLLCIKQIFKYNKINTDNIQFKKLKETNKTFNALTDIEMKQLMYYLYNSNITPKNRLIILLLIDTGARINELLNIKIQNINFNNNTIYLEKTKTNTPRYVPFTIKTSIELKQYIKNLNDTYLFNITLSGIESLFQRINNQLKFKEFHPHTLRHTLASNLHNNGASIMIIQQILGHTNVSTTQRYIHFKLDNILNSYSQIMN